MANKIPFRKSQVNATKVYESQASRQEDKNFYSSKEWLEIRAIVLAEQPLCQDCLRQGMITPAKAVHHISERKSRPDLALDKANLEPCCSACHNRKRKDQGKIASD